MSSHPATCEPYRHLLSEATRYFHLPDGLQLECGAHLEQAVIAYRTWGDPANAAQRAILVCHPLTASADADRWWPGMIGSGAAIDPARDFVVCANVPGSCYGSTGPASVGADGKRYRADFPRISVRDMVRAQRQLLDELGIRRLALVIGPSLGGMLALEWAASFPQRVAAIAPVGVGGRHSAWCIALSAAQRAAIRADENWCDGRYSDERPPAKGLAAARMMALCTYRSRDGLQQRFARDAHGEDGYQVESYLHYQGEKFHRRFDANSYIQLTRAMNDHDIARGRGEYFDVLEGITQPALVVSVSSDVLYPPTEQALLARHLPNASYHVLAADDGHDGFLTKTGPLARLVASFRETLAPAVPARATRRGAVTTAP